MKKNILVLVFTAIFLFFFIPQVFSIEEDESSWIDFFGLFPSEEPIKTDTDAETDKEIDTKADSKLDSIIGMPVVKEELMPDRFESEILNKSAVEVPRQNLIVKEKKLKVMPERC